MIRIALIGAGAHAVSQHVPALLDHERRHPGTLRLAVVCDRDRDRAAGVAQGAAVCDDWRLALDQADAVVACVPPTLTPAIARACAARDLPLLMEKPLAPTLAEAEAVVAELGTARVMASMNRRFDPMLRRLVQLVDGRVPRLIRIDFARENRSEADFVTFTGVHALDLAVHLGGAPQQPCLVRQGAWADARWTTAGGTVVEVAIRPTLGVNQERVLLAGDGWQGEARSGFFDDGLVRWRGAEERLGADAPGWRRFGTDAETDAFLAACQGRGAWSPTPADVLVATRIAAS
jgi:predicted dehydrogenase